jgi:hypothetical protein
MTPLPPLVCLRCDREHDPGERHSLRVELADWVRWKLRRTRRRRRS